VTAIAWPAIVAVGVGTFLLRASFLYLYERIDLPPRGERALELVPAAVLSALVAPSLLAPEGTVAVVGNDRLLAGVAALAVAWTTENIFATLVVGFGVLVGLQYLL